MKNEISAFLVRRFFLGQFTLCSIELCSPHTLRYIFAEQKHSGRAEKNSLEKFFKKIPQITGRNSFVYCFSARPECSPELLCEGECIEGYAEILFLIHYKI